MGSRAPVWLLRSRATVSPASASTSASAMAPCIGDPPRILLVAFHFAPSTAVGALRWTTMTSMLAEAGYAIDVITAAPQAQGAADTEGHPVVVRHVARPRDWLNARVTQLLRVRDRLRVRFRGATATDATRAPGHEMVRPHAWNPHAWNPHAWNPRAVTWDAEVGPPRRWRAWPSQLRGYLAAQLGMREERGWALRALDVARSLAERHTYRVVITSGPPFWPMAVGAAIAKERGVPFLADYRDPWTLDQVADPGDAWSAGWHLRRALERRFLREVHTIVMNTEPAAAEMRRAFPALAGKVVVVGNGSDATARRDAPTRTRFVVMYAGSLYNRRDPRLLFQASRRVIEEFGLTPAQFGVRLIGEVQEYAGVATSDHAAQAGIGAYVSIERALPRAEALDAAAEACVLVCLPDGLRYNVQAKVYEYIQLECWLLAFVAPGSAMEQILQPLGADLVLDESVESAARHLSRRWREFAAGTRPPRLDAHGEHARRRQVAKLLAVLPRDDGDARSRGATLGGA
jgi:hypothetical protein